MKSATASLNCLSLRRSVFKFEHDFGKQKHLRQLRIITHGLGGKPGGPYEIWRPAFSKPASRLHHRMGIPCPQSYISMHGYFIDRSVRKGTCIRKQAKTPNKHTCILIHPPMRTRRTYCPLIPAKMLTFPSKEITPSVL